MDLTFTSLNEAYNIHHVNTQSYIQPIQYSGQCIFCSNQDNRSCRKQFRANILSKPVDNYIKATAHLNGTN